MKRIISLLLIFMMVIGTNMTAYAEQNEIIDIPVQISVKTLNKQGVEETYFSPGEDIIFRYEISPQDIDLAQLPESQPVDIVLVSDTSGSMNESSGLNESDWINQNYTYYDWFDFDRWIDYNDIPKVEGNFEAWLYNYTELQDMTKYSEWIYKHTISLSFYRWRIEYAIEETDAQWQDRLNIHQETFDEWLANDYNNITEDRNKYIYKGYTYSEGLIKYVYKYFFQDKYFVYDEDNSYTGYYNEYELDNLMDYFPKEYIYENITYTLAELESIFNDNFSDYLLLTKEDSDFTNDEIVSPEGAMTYWEMNIKNTYLYNGVYYTYEEIQNYYDNFVNNNYIFDGIDYSYEELEQIYNNIARYKYYNIIVNPDYTEASSYVTMEDIDQVWKNLPETSRIGAEKKALKTFVDRMYESDVKDSISVSFIEFSSYSMVRNSLEKITDNYESLQDNIADIKPVGGTNSGDALRLASYMLNNDADRSKYIIFMTDGQATGWSYNSDYYWNSWVSLGIFNGYYLYDYQNSNYNNDSYGYYYYGNASEAYDVSDQTLKFENDYYYNTYNIHTDSGYERYANYYLQKVATDLVANRDITTYVIGVGDGTDDDQRAQNEQLAQNANATSDIGGLYFPVNNASKLESLYDSIAKDIIRQIPITNINISLPFISSEPLTFERNMTEDVLIKSIKVNGTEAINNNEYDEVYFSLDGNTLMGKLPDFTYTLNEEEGIFEAETMILEITAKIPDSMEDGDFGVDSTGSLTYDVIYGDDVENQTSIPSQVLVSIMKGLKPVGITSTYTYSRDGYDGDIESSLLHITPEAEYNGIDIVYGPNDEFVINIKPYNSDVKYSSEAFIVDLSNYHLDILNYDYSFKVRTYNKVFVPNEGVYVDRIGEEEISILNLNAPIYVGENQISDTVRKVNLSFSGPENLNSIAYGLSQPTSSFVPIVNGNNYAYPDDLMLSKGINTIIFEAENRYGNKTIMQTNQFIHARRPRIEPDTLTETSASFNIYTYDGAVLDQYSIIFIDEDDSETILPVALEGMNQVYTLTADISGVDFNENTRLKIVAKDDYKNVGILGSLNDPDGDGNGGGDDDDEDEEIEDEVTPGSFVSLIQIGLYDTLHGEFFDDIYARNSNVVLGMRYTYGIKFRYGSQDEMNIDFDNVDLKYINAKISGVSADLNVYNYYGNIRITGLADDLVEGNEYILLIDLTFNSSNTSEFVTTATVSMGSGDTLDKTATIKITPNIE